MAKLSPKQELAVLRKCMKLALDALQFYADPEQYHAIAIVPDRPSGGFADDFDRKHGHWLYERPMPGKLARRALTRMAKMVEAAEAKTSPPDGAAR